jgi:hypothetical protein
MRATIGCLVLALTALVSACSPDSSARVTPLPSRTPSANAAAAAITLTPSATATLTQPAAQPTGSNVASTPTPLQNDMPTGRSAQIAQATDTAMHPTPSKPITFDTNPVKIRFDEFYSGQSIRGGVILSDKLVALDGKDVMIEGYMAPPLKPALDFFVLTRERLSFCPFCSSAADWPIDIALAYMPEGKTTLATIDPIRITARLEVGVSQDFETGMYSLVRLYVKDLESIK